MDLEKKMIYCLRDKKDIDPDFRDTILTKILVSEFQTPVIFQHSVKEIPRFSP